MATKPSETPRCDALVALAPPSCGLNEMAEQHNKVLALARDLERALAASQERVKEERRRGDALYAALDKVGEQVKRLTAELKAMSVALAEGTDHD